MKLVTLDGLQQYRPDDEYRLNKAIGRPLRHDLGAYMVYCHAKNLTPWQKRIWEKRKAEIPFKSFLTYMPEGEVWRLGFSVV